MRLWEVLDTLPEGYELVRGRQGWLAVERGARAALLASGFGPDGGESLPPSGLVGRGALGLIESAGERWLVRRFHHGGFLRWLGERLFLQPSRPFRELVCAHALRAAGFSTPRVVAARALRSRPFGWRLALVSAHVAGRIEGADVLERRRRGELEESEWRRFLDTFGALIGRLHAAGFLHADLTPRNLLFERDLAAAWVLDLDRARFARPLSERARRDNLRRLYRSVRRREARARPFLRHADYLRFLSAYARAHGTEPDWRSDWVAIERRDRRRQPAHRLGWWLERRFGSGPEARDGGFRPA